jgi:hypothetical protein
MVDAYLDTPLFCYCSLCWLQGQTSHSVLVAAAGAVCALQLQWHAFHYILQQLERALDELTGSLECLLQVMAAGQHGRH